MRSSIIARSFKLRWFSSLVLVKVPTEQVLLTAFIRILLLSSTAVPLEFLDEFLFHLLVVVRDDTVQFVSRIVNVPLWLIMILVVHHSELGFVLLHLRLSAAFSRWLQSLQINVL